MEAHPARPFRRTGADRGAPTHLRARDGDPGVQGRGVLVRSRPTCARTRRPSTPGCTTSTTGRSRWATRPTAQAVLDDVEGVPVRRSRDVKRRERKKNPSPPFTTSTLQQEAAKRLGFSARTHHEHWRNASTKVVEVGARGTVGSHHLHANGLHPRVAGGAWARPGSGSQVEFGNDYVADCAPPVGGQAAEGRPGGPRGHPSHRRDAAPHRSGPLPGQRPGAPVRVDLAALRVRADGAGGVRHHDGRLRAPGQRRSAATCSGPPARW